MKRCLFAIFIFAIACRPARQVTVASSDAAKNTLVEILDKNASLAQFVQNKDSLNIQIIYTKIDRDEKNEPHFTDYTFSTSNPAYFYPASTVKMPIAFLALEKLNQLKNYGIDKFTTIVTDSAFAGETTAYTQPSAEDSKASIAHYIKQIFLVSDNEAFNRLYEFLGQEYIYDALRGKGLNHSIICHRLAVFLSQEQNRHTNPVSFYDTAGNTLYNQPAQYSRAVFPAFNDKLGKGYFSGNKLVNEPFDFSLKNHMALADLHQSLKAMLFPGSIKKEQRFDISEDDRNFLLRWMSSFPRESKFPTYDTTEYPDTYAKFFGRKLLPDSNIRIFSKSGWAYGFLTDVAYVVDFEHNVEFMLSATILCNSDGVFNDDHYDFKQTGYPFMQSLGKAIYDYELKREQKHLPDLSGFRFNYTDVK